MGRSRNRYSIYTVASFIPRKLQRAYIYIHYNTTYYIHQLYCVYTIYIYTEHLLPVDTTDSLLLYIEDTDLLINYGTDNLL